MEFISLFTKLLQQTSNASHITIKNYKSDLNHFIKWYENTYSHTFSPEKVTSQVLNKFQSSSGLTQASLKRRLAALKKFYSLLEKNNYSHNPFNSKTITQVEILNIEDVANYLHKRGATQVTVKNYLTDIKQFINWSKTVSRPTTATDILNPHLIEEYKLRLLQASTPQSSINRKLSSIRALSDFAYASGIIPTRPYHSNVKADKDEAEEISLEELMRLNSEKKNHSKLPLIRLFQKLLTPYFELEEKIATSIAFRLKSHEKKSKFQLKKNTSSFITRPQNMTVEDATRHFYSPLTPPSKATRFQKLTHHARHNRPKWYKKYHTLTVAHYIHFGLLIIGALMAGFLLYQNSLGTIFSDTILAAPTSPPKLLAFQGTLTDERDVPITDPSTVNFTVYTSESGNTSLWRETQRVSPDNTGTFTAYLGSVSPLSSQIFTQNNQLYLGVQLEGGEELRPRQRLASVAYASNSEYLQGMSPITQGGSGNKNVILALDSSGNLTIPGSDTTTFTSSGGSLKLTASSVIISSNASSNGNIILSPDGTGKVDLTGSLFNSSEKGTIFPGSLTISDQTVVSATTSASPAFTLLQSGTGDIFTASSASSTRFVIDNNGRVGINTNNPTEYLQINNGSIFLQGGGGRIYGDTLKVESTGSSPLLLQPSSSVGNVGIGTSSPTAATHIESGKNSPVLKLNFTGSGQNILDAQKSGSTVFLISEAGNVGLGTTTTSSRINLASSTSASGGISFGDTNLYRSSASTLTTDDSLTVGEDLTVSGTTTLNFNGTATTNGICHSGDNSDTTASNRSLVVCSGAPADIAEWYAASNNVEAGHIVELSSDILTYESEGADPSTGQVRGLGKQDISILKKAISLEKVLGVVSTAPYKTIGSDIKKALNNNQDYKAVPLALSGRVLLKIAHDSPEIEAGDAITLSRTASGKGTKATSPTFTVARALEPWNKDKEEILVYIQPTWYQPLALAENGSTQLSYSNEDGIALDNLLQNVSAGSMILVDRIQVGSLIAKDIIVQNSLSASEIIVSRLKVGAVEAREITTQALEITSDRITIGGTTLQKYIDERIRQASDSKNDKLAHISEVKTDVISPLSENELKIQNNASISGDLKANNISSEGNLSANSVHTERINSQSASISGTLEVDKLVANEIEGLEEKIASVTARQNTSSSSGSTQTVAKSESSTINQFETDTQGLALLPSHKSTYAIFEQDLSVYGTSTLTEATVLTNLTVGSGTTSLSITSTSLNSLDTLEIQPFAQAPISFMGGKVTLDTQGNLTIGGDTQILGTLAAKDAIFEYGLLTTQVQTGIISPLPEHDLAFKLGEKVDGSSQELQAQTSTGAAVLSVDNQGNVEASGSGTFSKLNFWNPPQAYAEISDLEVDTQGSAGKAAIKEGRRELTINNSNVTEKSLIYITPASNSQNKVVYLLRQVPGESFTVGITTASNEDIEFNWLIVN